MKLITSFIKSLFSLGWLGLVVLLMAGTIFIVSAYRGSTAFDQAIDSALLLNDLEGVVQPDLKDMQMNEAYALFALEYDVAYDTDFVQEAANYDAGIGDFLQQMQEEGRFDQDEEYAPLLQEALSDFENLRATHRQTFTDLVDAYQNDSFDPEVNQFELMQIENEQLDESLQYVIFLVDQSRRNALKLFPGEINFTIILGAVSFTMILLLALWGYQRIAAATWPLRDLTNAITGIGGDQYRANLLGSLLKKPGAAGRLARALNGLADGLQKQSAGLKDETARLRQELYESRRRRLKLFHDDQPRSESK